MSARDPHCKTHILTLNLPSSKIHVGPTGMELAPRKVVGPHVFHPIRE